MEKNWKYLIIGGVVAVLLVIAFLVMNSLGKAPADNNPSNNGQNQPTSTTLSEEKELKLKAFVKNFVSLYNSYRYADYTNMTALGDYQTPALQQQTADLVSSLEKTVPLGFSRETAVDENTFVYILDGGNPEVTIQARVTDSNDSSTGVNARQSESGNSYSVTATLKLLPFNEGWVVDEINIK